MQVKPSIVRLSPLTHNTTRTRYLGGQGIAIITFVVDVYQQGMRCLLTGPALLHLRCPAWPYCSFVTGGKCTIQASAVAQVRLSLLVSQVPGPDTGRSTFMTRQEQGYTLAKGLVSWLHATAGPAQAVKEGQRSAQPPGDERPRLKAH